MSLDRPNLSAAFAPKRPPVDRAAGLSGLLPAPRPRPSTSPSSAEPSTTEPTAPAQPAATSDEATRDEPARPVEPATTPSRTVRPIRTVKSAPVSESADTPANVAVYLEPAVHERARARRRSSDLTYDELVRIAFAETDEASIRAAFTPTSPASGASGMPVRQRRLRGTAGIQVQLRLTAPQRAWLDTTQQQYGAPSRSALVATVLRLYLDT